ncbi:glycogen branching protein [Corynebacterium glutamicum]|uniref:1,4-alpha-glucan branching protein GlgB n=1 Tax=Corynebacterium glutamicum TaxID=1718 RepID=UPI0004F8019E|nr:1,4-alpha-glucan branching protein GlgB [Corynebacterium glutamicum]AIK84910.1 glycogen branching protein [Corynebacterium glutamicum]AIK87694.1 glycogen branching protein [Corynebacterium glutamicum]
MTVDPASHITIPEADLARLRHCNHHDPHGFYGWHETEAGSVIRTRQVGATQVNLLIDDTSHVMTPIGDDIFAIDLGHRERADYRLEVTWPDQEPQVKADPYYFLPTVGEMDIYLFSEGRHERLWEILGANIKTYQTALGTVRGTAFTVWAPNAIGCAVVGGFNGWNASQHPMRSMGGSGLWELFIPGVEEGEVYKFALQTKEGQRRDKADPMARRAELAPATGSIVASSEYQWQDSEWLRERSQTDLASKPMSVYEVHLGSWRWGKNYEDLATELVDYVADLGYTHVEFLPVAEHPFGGSWGYQVTGYYAPTSRWGTPDQFRALVDAFHARGIGVIIDWVPAHFPKDDWALARFDGEALYEHPDWRRGEQKDWGTLVFDFGRNEVRNFLVANALYWIEEFHIDGLRVDAVASMLYLDYSREHGEWEPNIYGGRENLEAVQFLQEMNATVLRLHPGALTIAEESTSWPGVTAPTWDGGLGFSLKWNMGWMNDTLEYFSKNPVHRAFHHSELTFSLVYAFSERFVLPISHDEVVHGKGSLWDRMPGDTWNKAAGLRTFLAYMWSHPGKKLLFMGQEFGQREEWAEGQGLPWDIVDGWQGEYHEAIRTLTRSLNGVYSDSPALHTQDFTGEGFTWNKGDDATNNILAFTRFGSDGSQMLCVFNLSGTSQPEYQLGVAAGGEWKLVLNTDDAEFLGAENDIATSVQAAATPRDNFAYSLSLHVPPMSAQFYSLQK